MPKLVIPYSKPIINAIHTNNHIKIHKRALISPLMDNKYINKYVGRITLPKTLRNVDRGLYRFSFKEDLNYNYYTNINDNVGMGEFLKLNEFENAIYSSVTNNKKIDLYKGKIDDDRLIHKLENSINGYLDVMVIAGYTKVEGTPDIYHPSTIVSDNRINVTTSKNKTFTNISFNKIINYGTEARSLMKSNIHDIIVMDFERDRYYIIKRINKLRLTGLENVTMIKDLSTSSYKIFHIPVNNITKDAIADNIICNYFISTSFDKIIDKKYKYNRISISNDLWRDPGIYIKITSGKAHTEKDIIEFLNNLFKTTPMEILFAIDKPYIKDIHISGNKIPTHYDETYLRCNLSNVSLFYKSL